jgi:hypothetical protein
MKYNTDLIRVGLCKHKKGKNGVYASQEKLHFFKHTGEMTIQVWTGNDDDAPDMPGWACAHRETVEEDKISIREFRSIGK